MYLGGAKLVSLFAALLLFASDGMTADETGLPTDVASGWGSRWLKSMHHGYKAYGFQIVSEKEGHPVRLGSKSIKFEVRPGDCGRNDDWNDCENDRERHELSQLGNYQRNGDENWYAWSIFVPKDTVSIWPTKVHLGQFHQKKNNVIWLFSWTPDGYIVDNQVPGKGYTREFRRIAPTEEFLGRWVDITIHAKWSSGSTGLFEVYVDHAKRYEHSGQTIAQGDTSFFKFGIYRSFLSRYKAAQGVDKVPTQIIYYDELRKGKRLSEVDQVGIVKLQERLKAAGMYSSKIDGRWGPGTMTGINSLLASQGKSPITDYSMDIWTALPSE